MLFQNSNTATEFKQEMTNLKHIITKTSSIALINTISVEDLKLYTTSKKN